MNELMSKIEKIAEKNPEGFTVLLPSLHHAKRGWVVGVAETQNSFGEAGLKWVIEFALANNTAIGGWLYEGRFYYDAVLLLNDKEEAIREGRKNNQIGIFNIETVTYIEL